MSALRRMHMAASSAKGVSSAELNTLQNKILDSMLRFSFRKKWRAGSPTSGAGKGRMVRQKPPECSCRSMTFNLGRSKCHQITPVLCRTDCEKWLTHTLCSVTDGPDAGSLMYMLQRFCLSPMALTTRRLIKLAHILPFQRISLL